MPSPEQERMDALTEAIARLLRRQEETERRLARIEGALNLQREAALAPQAPPPAAPPSAAAPEPQASPREFESRMGLTWINRIGVITLVLGVAFFFNYAVEKQWINEATWIALGTAAGIAILIAGDRIWRGGQRIFAQGISGAGIAILYVSFYAGYALYHVLAQGVAFLLMVLTTAIAGALAMRYGAAAIAALGLFGGYVTPLLLGAAEDRPWFLFSYVLLLDVGAAIVARGRGWRALQALAFLATAVIYASRFQLPVKPERQPVDTIFLLAYYGLFALLDVPWIVMGAQVLAGLAAACIWGPSVLPYLALALLLLLAGVAIADRRGWFGAPAAAFASFWLSYFVWYPQQGSARPLPPVLALLTAVFVIFLAWVPWRALVRGIAPRSHDLLILALNGIVYFGACYALLEPGYDAFVGLFAAALAAVHLALAWLLWQPQPKAALLLAGMGWAFLVLAAPLQFSGYRTAMAWSAEGAVLAWMGARLHERRASQAAPVIFALVLAHLALVESWAAAARFLTFAVAAASMWAAAYWMRSGWAALATYISGHFVMLWGLSLETADWARRGARPEDLRSVQSTSLTILMAAYAVLLVSIGVAARSPLNRMLGLGLIAIVVAKLYIYDVWYLGLFYRMAAFAVLGVLLLAMSYLYSRFRTSIESWWRNARP